MGLRVTVIEQLGWTSKLFPRYINNIIFIEDLNNVLIRAYGCNDASMYTQERGD